MVDMAVSDPSVRLIRAFLPESQQVIGSFGWDLSMDPADPP